MLSEAPTNITKLPRPAQVPALPTTYRGYTIEVRPSDGKWTARIRKDGGEKFTGLRATTPGQARIDAERTIDVLLSPDPMAMPGAVAFCDAMAEGRLR